MENENQDFITAPQKNGAEKSMTYDNWQGRIAQYDFVENKDYISFPKKRKRAVGGTNL